jgi:microcompartment protein CcmK/EutM
MRIAEVIGTVTLSRVHPALTGLRFVLGVPYSLKALEIGQPDGEDVIIVDRLSAGHGSQIGFSEGAEAAVPFLPERKPVDAYCGCILDRVVLGEKRGQGTFRHENMGEARPRQ